MKLRAVFLIVLSALASAAIASAQTADVDFGTSEQTIQGFGGSTAWMPQMSTAQADALFGMGSGQLGLSILRVRIDYTSTTGGANWATELANAQEAIAAGSNVKVFATPWTPPIAWKSNDSDIGGTLNTSDYAAYANYLNLFTSYMAAGGVNLYAISMQNEPDANVDYESCSWTGATMDAWAAAEGSTITTKLMMPESESFNTAYSTPTLEDSSAVGNVSIVAGHLYNTGESPNLTPTPASTILPAGVEKDVWETEHYLTPSGSQPAIADGIQAAEEIHASLVTGGYNAYLWWWVADWDNDGSVQNYGLVTEDPADVPTYYGLALGQFAKYVRPGYVRVGATANPTSGVDVSAYSGSGNYVIVAINSNSSASSVSFDLSGADIGQFVPYQTSATNNMAQLSAVTVSNNDAFTYSLPGQSITTFVGTLSTTPGFELTTSATSLTVEQGKTATDTITVADLNGFTGSVDLAASGLPSGVTASFGTNPTTGSSVLTLTASSTATTGLATITITGTSGSVTSTNSIALTITAGPGSSSITAGSVYTLINEASGQCAINSSNTLEQSACGAGASEEWEFTADATFSGYYQVAPYSALTDSWNVVGDSTAAGTGIQIQNYAASQSNEVFKPTLLSTGFFEFSDKNSGLCVTAINNTSGSPLEIEPCTGATDQSWALDTVASSSPGFTLSPSVASLSVTQGGTATDTITVTDTGGFTGSVTLAATGLPSGVTVAYGTNPTTGTSGLTFTASSTATMGASTVTITGTSGSTTATTNITLSVNASESFTLSPSAGSLSVTQGSTGTDTVTVTDTGGFTGSVTLAASGLPSGVTASFGTNPTTGSSVLTLTASSTATAGSSTVTITGTSGSTTATTTIALTVSSSSSSAISSGSYYTIVNQASGLCMIDSSSSTLEQSTCGAGTSEEWIFTANSYYSGGYYQIAPYSASGDSWNVVGDSTSAGTGIQIQNFSSGQNNEVFKPTLLSTGYYEFSAENNSGLCVTAINSTVGQELETETCTGASDQSWALDLVSSSSGTPSFTLSPSASSLSVTQGSTATDTVSVTDVDGFTGSVTLAASGLPSGVTAAFGTNPTTGSSVLTLTAGSTATVGSATVTITGTSGSTNATTTIALTVSASSSSAISSGSYYTIVNEASGDCINDPNGATSNGTAVQQSACSSGNVDQEWMLTATSVSGYYEVSTHNSSSAAWNVVGNSTSAGTGIQLYGYSAQSNEEFEPELLSTGYYELIDHNSGLCVSDPNGSTTSGQKLEIETCNGSASESWKLNLQ